MTPMTISAGAVAPGTLVQAHQPEMATALSVIAWLSVAATVLSLIIGAALSLIIWTVAG